MFVWLQNPLMWNTRLESFCKNTFFCELPDLLTTNFIIMGPRSTIRNPKLKLGHRQKSILIISNLMIPDTILLLQLVNPLNVTFIERVRAWTPPSTAPSVSLVISSRFPTKQKQVRILLLFSVDHAKNPFSFPNCITVLLLPFNWASPKTNHFHLNSLLTQSEDSNGTWLKDPPLHICKYPISLEIRSTRSLLMDQWNKEPLLSMADFSQILLSSVSSILARLTKKQDVFVSIFPKQKWN